MAETETEFQGYTGDCVWAALHMAAHRIAPLRYPLPDGATLDRFTSEAIAAGIGVGPRGEATPGQLKTMMERWGFTYQIAYDYNGNTIPRDTLREILDDYTGPPTNRPVLLGFTNGQALVGDERGPHGHEIAVLRNYDAAHGGYPCGDGDSQAARSGQFSYYSLDVLEAAAPDSAYVMTGVPEVRWSKNADGTATDKLGHHAGTGIAARIFADGKEGTDGLTGETYYAPSECFLVLEDGTVYTWDPTDGVHSDRAGVVMSRMYDLLAAARVNQRSAADDAYVVAIKSITAAIQNIGK